MAARRSQIFDCSTICHKMKFAVLFVMLASAKEAPFDVDTAAEPGGVNGQQSGQSSSQSNSRESAILQFQYFINGDALHARRSMLVAHAVIACFVWAVLIPVGGILLRINFKAPWIVRVHAILQITSFFFYVAAVGLGIFLINTLGAFSSFAWKDAHPRLGLAILALAAIQPFLGYAHHRLFKRRLAEVRQRGNNAVPESTIWGHAHMWLGRILILLGMINGGLGLRLAGESPAWLMPASTGAKIAYSVTVSLTVVAYVIVIIVSARRGRRGNRQNLNIDSGEDVPHIEEQKVSRDASGRHH